MYRGLGALALSTILAVPHALPAQTQNQRTNIAINAVATSAVAAVSAWVQGKPTPKPAIIGALTGAGLGFLKLSAAREEDLGLLSYLGSHALVNITRNAIDDVPVFSRYAQDLGPITISRTCDSVCTNRYEWSINDAVHLTRLLLAGYNLKAGASLRTGVPVLEGDLPGNVRGRTMGNFFVVDAVDWDSRHPTKCELVNYVLAHEVSHAIQRGQGKVGASIMQEKIESYPLLQRIGDTLRRMHISTDDMYSEAIMIFPRLMSGQPVEAELDAAAKTGHYRC